MNKFNMTDFASNVVGQPLKIFEPTNNIIFFNHKDGQNVEVLRISPNDGITANPDIPIDEAADAVLRAADSMLCQMIEKRIKDEHHRLATLIERMPFGTTSDSFAVWVRNGGKA